jgi:hypothetical protein
VPCEMHAITVDLASGFLQVPLGEDHKKSSLLDAEVPLRILQYANGYMFSTSHISVTKEYCFKWTVTDQGTHLFR